MTKQEEATHPIRLMAESLADTSELLLSLPVPIPPGAPDNYNDRLRDILVRHRDTVLGIFQKIA